MPIIDTKAVSELEGKRPNSLDVKNWVAKIRTLEQTFDDALKGDLTVLKWLKDALPSTDNKMLSGLIKWDEVSKQLKEAGYTSHQVGSKVSSADTSPTGVAQMIIGQIITSIDENRMTGIDRRAGKVLEAAIAKLETASSVATDGRADGASWTDSLGDRTGRQKS